MAGHSFYNKHGWRVHKPIVLPKESPIISKTVADMLWAKARQEPDRVAVHLEDQSTISFQEIARKARALYLFFKKMGLEAGDVISFQLPNWYEAVVINVAIAALGGVVNPIPPIYRGAELKFILQDSGAKLLFIPENYRSHNYLRMLEAIRPELPDLKALVIVRGDSGHYKYERIVSNSDRWDLDLSPVEPNDLKMLMYTSGTTGNAKGVLHTHRSINYTHADYMRIWQINDQDIMFMPSPVTHGTGYILGLEIPFFTGASVALMDIWDPARAVSYMDKVKATLCAGATVFLKDLVEEAGRIGNKLPSLRLFSCGGSAIPSSIIFKAAEVLERCRAVRVYGSTEAPLVTKGFVGVDELNLAAETDGKISGFDVRIEDGEGNVLGTNQTGDILVRGAPLMVGYTDPQETENAFTQDGFFQTGDRGFITSENGLVITGRRKDLIIRGGENISPWEIEDALERHPAIREVSVVSMPHPRLGEAVCACIIVRDGCEAPSLMDLVEYLDECGLARQKFPERLEYLETFPRTASGKVRKDILRDALKKQLKIEHKA